MKLPADYHRVTILDFEYDHPYPPLGFHAIDEHQSGYGDHFGLYWPIGREDEEPIVAETYHDSGSIEPKFSSLARMLAAAGDDAECLLETPTFEDDPNSPAARFYQARADLERQEVNAAISHLEAAVSRLPEYTEAQTLLWTQYRRIGAQERAIKSAIQAIISPNCFGPVPTQTIQWLARQSTCAPEWERDPIWLNRNRLSLKFGGVKENDDYKILRDAIDQYLDQSAYIQGMTLMQTYAHLMWTETVSFRERYRFNVKEFVAWQREVAETRYGTSRVLKT